MLTARYPKSNNLPKSYLARQLCVTPRAVKGLTQNLSSFGSCRCLGRSAGNFDFHTHRAGRIASCQPHLNSTAFAWCWYPHAIR